MENYMEVMKRTVELSDSCLGALEHIKVRLNEGAFEDTVRLMDDFVNGFYQIEKSMQGFISELSSNQLEETTNQLRSAMEHVVSAYEQGNSGKALEIILLNMLPSCKKWKVEIEKSLHPYVLS
jgi:hypothetical protein